MSKKRLLTFMLVFMLVVPALCDWKTYTQEDEVTGEKTAYAKSSYTSPKYAMSYPYNDIEAWIGVGSDGDREWAYIGFSSSLNLDNITLRDDNGNEIVRPRTKWDEELIELDLRHEPGSRFLTFAWSDIQEGFVRSIAEHNTFLLELEWRGQGKVYFEFSLKGSTAALREMRRLVNK